MKKVRKMKRIDCLLTKFSLKELNAELNPAIIVTPKFKNEDLLILKGELQALAQRIDEELGIRLVKFSDKKSPYN